MSFMKKRSELKIFHYNFLPENRRGSSPKNSFFPKNHKGLSAVITTLILIALVISAIAIVWVTVTNLLTNRLDAAESCMNIFEKVEINELYTCYNSSSNKFQFSINIREINIEEIIVSVSGEGTTKSYTLTNEARTIEHLANYSFGNFGIDLIKLPGKNSGLTYISDYFSSTPDSVKIAPVINGNQCEVSDSVLEIYSC